MSLRLRARPIAVTWNVAENLWCRLLAFKFDQRTKNDLNREVHHGTCSEVEEALVHHPCTEDQVLTLRLEVGVEVQPHVWNGKDLTSIRRIRVLSS